MFWFTHPGSRPPAAIIESARKNDEYNLDSDRPLLSPGAGDLTPLLMPRFFNLDQAQRLLPEIDSSIREAIALKAAYFQSGDEIRDAALRVSMLGGSVMDRGAAIAQKERHERSGAELNAVIEKIHEAGCVVKDLDIGLIDFPTLLRGQEVYLCWKLGEDGIRFWHGLDEGFQGRKAIDQDFLDNHQGELAN